MAKRWGQERLLGCMLGILRDTWLCLLGENVLSHRPVLSGSLRRGQQVLPDGEPPATALQGTIWLMVSLVMGVRVGSAGERVHRGRTPLEFSSREGRGCPQFLPPPPGSGTFFP